MLHLEQSAPQQALPADAEDGAAEGLTLALRCAERQCPADQAETSYLFIKRPIYLPRINGA
ncbi:MAG: hypothetical protein COX52_03010 [Syntrophobacterales bacterium CG23_combo_of_CG06-09_8_20_14_all_48_27]|nr:MAG: hypothetical protein COX52_03010 [Syntrophobacterales bacterium CG23_combo_of_CG06-09_8_20_14_all_48_27]